MVAALVGLLGLSPAASGAESSLADRALRRAADILTDMDGPVGRVYFPAFSTNPNEGPTYGFLPVWLVTNDKRQIERIFAPLVTYNRTFGPAFSGTYYRYPSSLSSLRLVLEKAARVNHRAAARYQDLGFMDGRCALKLDSNYEADGTPRFYGVGPRSPRGAEASYRLVEKLVDAQVGVKYLGAWQLAAGWRARATEAGPGPFPTPIRLEEGRRGTSVFSGPRLALSRDTRDLPSTPASGSLSEAFVEFRDRAFGSSSTHQRYGGQWRAYAPHGRSLVAAARVQGEWTRGGEVALPGLATLGGPRSVRAYPEGRFTDRGSFVASVEERWTAHELGVVNASTQFQVAPFLDVGTVFDAPGSLQASTFLPAAGLALRAVVRPTVVGRVEVGVGREGAAVFVGIDYPL